jgi:DNA polymerase-3 subunit delta
MAKASANPAAPVVLVCGDDDFTVKQRAKALYDQWCGELGGMDHEVVDAVAANTGDALGKLNKLRAALDTLPFFGGAKAVWFRDCNFLGEDRTASSAAVTAALTEFAEMLKGFKWDGVRLLISAGKPDKRRSFYKTLEKLGTVESFVALSADDKEWAGRAETEVLRLVRAVGPNLRALASETEKLLLYVGDRAEVALTDVRTLTTRQKLAQAFALGEALGDRDLGKLMRVLDQELWEIRTGADKKKSEIGLLYGLISKVRGMLMLKDLANSGALKPVRDYNAFKTQMDRVSQSAGEGMPDDKRFNPLAGHPFVVFKTFNQSANYELPELVRAMDLLLGANVKLVSSGLDDAMVLQQALVDIVGLKPRRTVR